MAKIQLFLSMWIVLGAYGATFYGMFAYLVTYEKRTFPVRLLMAVGTYFVNLATGPIVTIRVFLPVRYR